MSDAIARFGSRYRAALLLGLLVVLAIASYRIVAGLTEYRLVIPIDSADGLYAGNERGRDRTHARKHDAQLPFCRLYV